MGGEDVGEIGVGLRRGGREGGRGLRGKFTKESTKKSVDLYPPAFILARPVSFCLTARNKEKATRERHICGATAAAAAAAAVDSL